MLISVGNNNVSFGVIKLQNLNLKVFLQRHVTYFRLSSSEKEEDFLFLCLGTERLEELDNVPSESEESESLENASSDTRFF